LFCFW